MLEKDGQNKVFSSRTKKIIKSRNQYNRKKQNREELKAKDNSLKMLIKSVLP